MTSNIVINDTTTTKLVTCYVVIESVPKLPDDLQFPNDLPNLPVAHSEYYANGIEIGQRQYLLESYLTCIIIAPLRIYQTVMSCNLGRLHIISKN